MKTCIQRAAVVLMLLAPLTMMACASADDVLVNKEAGFYYGAASGTTEAAATDSAYNDLIYNILTESGSIKAEKKAKFVVTQEIKDAFAILKLRAYHSEKKSDTKFNVIFRLESKEWDKAEAVRLAALRTDLEGKFTAAQGDAKKSVFEKIKSGVELMAAINRHGVPGKLTATDGKLLYEAIQVWASDLISGATLSVSPDSGLLKSGATLKLTAVDKGGKALSSLPVAIIWAGTSGESPAVRASTDAKGNSAVIFPENSPYKNQKIALKVSTDLASLDPAFPFLAGLDASLLKSFAFRQSDDMEKMGTDEVKVPGGSYTTGKVPQDTTFGVSAKEKARQATVVTFYMDRNLVTNAQYKTFLESTGVSKDAWPDSMDDEAFNKADQPVVGISLEDAKKYAAWISGILGVAKRLPTEDEYEIAARAGMNSIYPWGDQKPSDGVRANYAGNGRFEATSPVGSFDNGKNPLGLNDMVGNVWQWTSSLNDEGKAIAKGGSYMDSASNLRISNRRFDDPETGHADIGFRLIREAANE